MTRNLHSVFVKKIKEKLRSLKGMHDGDVHVFTVNANYGRYKIAVGPLKHNHDFPLEIEGEIHHLFVTPDSITPNPSRRQINENLRHTVIMKDLSIHLKDPSGHGVQLSAHDSGVKPHEYINLAGREGTQLVRNAKAHGKLSRAAYNIIQKDILKSIEKSRAKHKI